MTRLSEAKRLIRCRFMARYTLRELANYLKDAEDEEEPYEDGPGSPLMDEALSLARAGPVLPLLGDAEDDEEEAKTSWTV